MLVPDFFPLPTPFKMLNNTKQGVHGHPYVMHTRGLQQLFGLDPEIKVQFNAWTVETDVRQQRYQLSAETVCVCVCVCR